MDFSDVEKYLPGSSFLVTYMAGPFPDDEQNEAIQSFLEQGGRWLAFHGSSGPNTPGARQPQRETRRRSFLKT